MHRVLVLGAGKIGSLVACLLSQHGGHEVHLGDVSLEGPKHLVEDLGLRRVTPSILDVRRPDAVGTYLSAYPVDAVTELARAKASRIPDPSLTVGWRQFKESDEEAWLFGIAVPLPLFSLGQDAVTAASSRFNSAKAHELSDRNQARATLRSAWQALADAKAEAEVLGKEVVPAATDGFAAAEVGYPAGQFSLLELLDAQRTLFDARQQLLTARTNCHLAAIELQRLQGPEAPVVTQQLQSP